MSVPLDPVAEARARQSLGRSDDAILAAAADALRRRGAGGAIIDLGCGAGQLRAHLEGLATGYVGVDGVRYEAFPAGLSFVPCDLDAGPVPLPTGGADVVVSLETVEHLENPRAFCREAVRLLCPGGWLIVSTPNQRSLLSLGALVTKGHFAAFGDTSYPAHRTALLDTDLRRIAVENGLADVAIEFTCRGRMPLTGSHYPVAVSRAFPRACSDNVLLVGRKRT